MNPCPQCPSGRFCQPCKAKLMAKANEAETYVARLKQGDRSVIPLTDHHRKIKTDAISKRLSNSTPDCSRTKRK